MKDAVISECGKYRYYLSRKLDSRDSNHGVTTFIMLNPSTADATQDDPTIRRCMAFGRAWRSRAIQVINLFAARATSPKDMMAMDDPVGPDNRKWWDYASEVSRHSSSIPQRVICAWGAHGGFMEQDLTAMGWLDEWKAVRDTAGHARHCFGITKEGHPRHPLYVAAATPLIKYDGRRWKAFNGKSVLEQPTRDTEAKENDHG
jgi:hypothetical protein